MASSNLEMADQELLAFFTCAVDVSAQSYSSGGGGRSDVEAGLVDPHHRRELAQWERSNSTFRQLTRDSAAVLASVYCPYGEPDLRSIALRPSWGSEIGRAHV